jgi:hypothetical protein
MMSTSEKGQYEGSCDNDDVKFFRRILVICINDGIECINFLVSNNLGFS